MLALNFQMRKELFIWGLARRMTNNINSKTAFVVGFPRSGTTMLTSWISEFTGVVSTPETHFFSDLFDSHIFPSRPVLPSVLVKEAKSRLRFRDLEINFDEVVDRLSDKKIGRTAFFQGCLTKFGQDNDADLVIEKTPHHLNYLDVIENKFVDVKIIAIVRDGRDCLLSLDRVVWANRSKFEYALEWSNFSRKLTAFKKKHPCMVMTIRYEDFLAETDFYEEKIKAFLGIDGRPRKKGLSPVRTIPEWEMEWKSEATEKLRLFHAPAWKSANAEFVSWAEKIMGDELISWGYASGRSKWSNRFCVKAYPALTFIRRWRIKLTYGIGWRSTLPSERFLSRISSINRRR